PHCAIPTLDDRNAGREKAGGRGASRHRKRALRPSLKSAILHRRIVGLYASGAGSSSDGGLADSQSPLASAHQCSFPEKLGGSGVAATRAWKVVGLRARRQAVQADDE